jgi:hypothetical protein
MKIYKQMHDYDAYMCQCILNMDLAFPITTNGHHFAYVMSVESFDIYFVKSNSAQAVALNHAYQETDFT